jgi:hypothetical protein
MDSQLLRRRSQCQLSFRNQHIDTQPWFKHSQAQQLVGTINADVINRLIILSSRQVTLWSRGTKRRSPPSSLPLPFFLLHLATRPVRLPYHFPFLPSHNVNMLTAPPRLDSQIWKKTRLKNPLQDASTSPCPPRRRHHANSPSRQ